MYVVKLTTPTVEFGVPGVTAKGWYLQTLDGKLATFETVEAAWEQANKYDGPANVTIEPVQVWK